MKRSLMVPGSLSSALHTMYFTGSGCLRTRSHFIDVGKPAPPIPRSSASFRTPTPPSQSFVANRRRTTPYFSPPPHRSEPPPTPPPPRHSPPSSPPPTPPRPT